MAYVNQILGRLYLALYRDRSGATAIEYGLLAAGVSVAIIATVFLLGEELDKFFNQVVTELQTKSGG